MKTTDWLKVGLVDNPFISTPPLPCEEIVWADMVSLKEKIQSRFKYSLSTSPSTLILNYGPWGGGKTHASRYFSQTPILDALCKECDAKFPLSIVINIPRGTKDVIRAIYLSIIDTIGLDLVQVSLSKMAENLGNKFIVIVQGFVRSKAFVDAILRLSGKSISPQQMKMKFTENSEVSFALKLYFLASASAGDLKTLRLSRDIESGSDMIEILSGIFNLLLYSDTTTEPQFSEIILWFDEMEEIISLPGKEQVTLTSLIRDLTDFIPKNLTMFVNFTPRAGGKIEEVSRYLSDAVWSRFRERIEFNELTPDEIEQYILELINAPKYRSKELSSQIADKYFPFDKDSLQYLSTILKSHAVPRYINEICSLIVENYLNTPSEIDARIDKTFIRSMETEINTMLLYK